MREIPLFGGRSHSGGVSLGWEASFRGWGEGGESIRMGGSHFEEGPISGGGVPL